MFVLFGLYDIATKIKFCMYYVDFHPPKQIEDTFVQHLTLTTYIAIADEIGRQVVDHFSTPVTIHTVQYNLQRSRQQQFTRTCS